MQDSIIKRARKAGMAAWKEMRGPQGDQNLILAGLNDGRDITRGNVEGLDYLAPQDKILRYQAQRSYEVYSDMLRDDRIQATFTQRRAAVVSCPWEVTPGGTRRIDRIAADFIREQLSNLRWNEITDKMLYGVYYGYSVAEMIWGRDGGLVIPLDIIVRERRRFVFQIGDSDQFMSIRGFQPKLLTTANPTGEPLPPQKFWIFSAGADNDDEPYGRGLAHSLYWPVWFKKNHTLFWLTYHEKFGAPTPLGRYPKNITETEKQKFLEAVKAIHTDSALVVPEGMQIELIEAARAGAADYKAFCEQMNRAITTVILSENMTVEDGASKSLGQGGVAQVHMAVRQEVVAADARLINDSFKRQVIAWLVGWNFPGAELPDLRCLLDDTHKLERQSERDKRIADMGWLPSQEYLEKTYGIELKEKPPPALPPGLPSPPAGDAGDAPLDFAENDPPPIEDLDEVLDAIDAKEWDKVAAGLVAPILNRANQNPADLIKDLETMRPGMNTRELEGRLARLLFVADAWGRLSVDAAPDAPAPPRPSAVPPSPTAPAVPPSPTAPAAPPRQPPPGSRAPGRGSVPPRSPVSLGYALNLPPSRAIDYFQQKGFTISWNWQDTWAEANNRAFTVAKATEESILKTIREGLDNALTQGQTQAQFIDELQPLLEKAGWWGKGPVMSPDGVEEIVQMGSPSRLQVIFRTNMRVAYGAGRWKQQQENADSRPFLQYVAVRDERTRHNHLELDGLVFPIDDEFWHDFYPPNGFNCRCTVEALDQEDLNELNLRVSSSAGKLRKITQEAGQETRQGVEYEFTDEDGKKKTVAPDPGWSYNPGM